jgi:lactosylceramide 4-alpha-galactosyltransferase
MASRFFLIWTTDVSTFSPRYLRSIESILRWHPDARVDVLSNTLPLHHFSTLGLRVHVERYSLEELTRDTPAAAWYARRHVWARSAYFPNHEADLLRLLTLWRRGGVYVDVDVVFVRALRLPHGCDGAVGIESGEGGIRGDATSVLTLDAAAAALIPSESAIVCNAVMAVRAGSALLARSLNTFVHEYTPLTPGLSMLELYAKGEWGAMGPLLLTRTLRADADANHTATGSSRAVCIMERAAFYALEPAETSRHFGPWVEARDGPALARLQERGAFAVHYWNGLTRDLPLHCSSLIHRLLDGCAPACKTPLPCYS